jgi:hypothetical protein
MQVGFGVSLECGAFGTALVKIQSANKLAHSKEAPLDKTGAA